MSLQEYCDLLGWTVARLAREARIDYSTAKKALDGEAIRSRQASQIADALSKAMGKKIYPGEVAGLAIS